MTRRSLGEGSLTWARGSEECSLPWRGRHGDIAAPSGQRGHQGAGKGMALSQLAFVFYQVGQLSSTFWVGFPSPWKFSLESPSQTDPQVCLIDALGYILIQSGWSRRLIITGTFIHDQYIVLFCSTGVDRYA